MIKRNSRKIMLQRCLIVLGLIMFITACDKNDDNIENISTYDLTLTDNTKVAVCHKGKNEIVISYSAVETHQSHGDAVDLDGDGFYDKESPCSMGVDCDDRNELINGNAEEIPYNGIDDDCNPETLDDDLDRDGYVRADDCDDDNSSINPGIVEIPYNGIDDDCDPATLDDDLDNDGYNKIDDCDDSDAEVNPGSNEVCGNSKDDNCNDIIDENCITDTPDITVVEVNEGNWEYGYGYAAVDDFRYLTQRKVDGSITRLSSPSDYWWSIAQNTSDVDFTDGHSITYPALSKGIVVMHPGNSSDLRIKVRFTAPENGNYNFDTAFTLVDAQALNGGARVEIFSQGISIYSSLLSQSRLVWESGSVYLEEGQMITFQIDSNGNYFNDSVAAELKAVKS